MLFTARARKRSGTSLAVAGAVAIVIGVSIIPELPASLTGFRVMRLIRVSR